jgi:hypothetical protein
MLFSFYLKMFNELPTLNLIADRIFWPLLYPFVLCASDDLYAARDVDAKVV